MDNAGGTVMIAANPFSGAGANRRYVERLAEALRARGVGVRLVWDKDERGRLLADRNLAGWCRGVVCAGGDGSMADVVNELAKGAGLGAVPVAMLPLGNENLFAREFGFDRHVERLAEAVGRGDSRRMDVGLLGERVFTLMASVGFDAEVVHRLAAWRAGGAAGASGKLRRVSRWSYVPRMLAGLRGYGYPRLTVEADGVKVSGSHVFVFNLPWYGMHLGIGAGAKGDDGLLDWVVFERAGARAVVGYMGSVWAGRHRRRADVVSGRAKRVKVEAEGPAAVQADGDPAGFTPMEAVVSAASLRVVEMRGV